MPQIKRIGNQTGGNGDFPLEKFFKRVFVMVEINQRGNSQTGNQGGGAREIGGLFRIGKQAGGQYARGKQCADGGIPFPDGGIPLLPVPHPHGGQRSDQHFAGAQVGQVIFIERGRHKGSGKA